ncbi:MAG: hypothetical protein GX640_01905 [Fibrobacter sp.]|nr:hypothetical protein [Fibrobacter sp.]
MAARKLTPEERLAFWMRKAKRLQRSNSAGVEERIKLQQKNQYLEEEIKKHKELGDMILQANFKMQDRICEYNKTIHILSEKISDLKEDVKELKSDSAESWKTETVPEKGISLVDFDSELTDLLLECGIYPEISTGE